MAAGHSVGTIFAEVGLDFTPYTRAQKTLLKDATTTTINIEKSYKNLGIKSAKEFDLMRAKISNSYERITKDAKTSADDILRAEKAKNEQLKRLNEQQYGSQKSSLADLKNNWLAVTASIVAAWYSVQRTMNAVKGIVLDAARYETLGIAMKTVGKNAGYSAEEMAKFQKGLEVTGISMSGSRQALTRMAQAQLDLTHSSELARIAQDAAVIGAMNSTEAFNTMVYGIQSANVRVLRTIGINVSWEESYKKMAEQLGRTVDSFSESEKASIRLNAVLEAGKNITGTYEGAMQTAGKQLLSLERYFDNLKVQIGESLVPLLGELVTATTEYIKSLNPADIRFIADSIKILAESFVFLGKSVFSIPKWIMDVASAMQTEVTAIVDVDAIVKQNTRSWVDYSRQLNATEKDYLALATASGQRIAPAPRGPTAAEIKAAEQARKQAEAERLKEDEAIFKFDYKNAQEQANKLRQIKEIDWEKDKKIQDKIAKDRESDLKKEIRDEEKAAADKAKAYRSMYKDMKGGASRDFDFQVDLLQKQRDEYINLTHDKNTADQWFSEQYQKLLIENYQKSDDFVKGVQAGFMDLTRDQYTWGQAGYDTVKTFADSSTSAIEGFINPTKDSFLDLGTAASSIFDDMLNAWSQMLAKMIDQWLMSGIAGLFSGQGFSGFNLDAFIGGGSSVSPTGGLGSLLGGGAATGIGATNAGGVGGAMSLQVGAPATVSADAAYTSSLSAPASGAGTTTIGGVTGSTAGLAGVSAGAAVFLAGTVDFWSHWGEKTSPAALEYIQAWLRNDPAVPGFENSPPGSGGYGYQSMMSPYIFTQWLPDMLWGVNHSTEAAKDPYFAELANKIYNREVGIDEIAKELGTAPNYWIDPTAHAMGGVLKARDMLMPTKGGEGLFSGQPGEGVVSHRGMKALERLNNGEIGGDTHVHLYIDGREIGYTVADQSGKNAQLISALRKAVR